jgi:hypothetical protein
VGGTAVGAAGSSVAGASVTTGSTTGASVATTGGSVAAGWVVAVAHPLIKMAISKKMVNNFVRMSSFSFLFSQVIDIFESSESAELD